MPMKALEIPYPDDLPAQLGKTSEEFEQELRFLVVAKLYELGRISSGRAAELAGMERIEFLRSLGQYRISILNYCPEELEREIEDAKARARRVVDRRR
jgi:predicted HTH domain antitoxin